MSTHTGCPGLMVAPSGQQVLPTQQAPSWQLPSSQLFESSAENVQPESTSQTSSVQGSPSSHCACTGVWSATPPLQLSTVQGIPSSGTWSSLFV